MAGAAPKEPGRYHHGELRRALIEEALEIVATHGVEDLRLREIARRLNVNHRAVYRHFADREALILEVAIDGWRQLGERMKRARRTTKTPVRASLRAYIRFALTRGGHYRCMLGRGSATLDQSPLLRRATVDTIRIVETEIEEQTNERGAPVRDRVFGLWGLSHGLCELVLCGHARVRSTRMAEDWILGLCEPILDEHDLR